MGKTRQTGNIVSDGLVSVATSTDTLNIGTGVTIYGSSGIISATSLYVGGIQVIGGGGGGSVAGSDGQIQYNNGGSFGGASQLYYDDVNNRVGIGTDNPSVKLHVHEGTIRATNTAKNNFTELGTDGNIEIKRNGGGAFIDFADDVTQDFDVRIQEASNGLKFITGGSGSTSEKLRITSAGNVGINTTAPEETLTVYKDGTAALFRGNDYSVSALTSTPRLRFGTNTSYAGYMELGAYGNINNLDTKGRDFKLFSSSVDPILYIKDDTGNVGIGTDNPTEELDVYKTSNDVIIRARTTTAGAYFNAQSGVSDYYGLRLYRGSTENWFIGAYGSANLQIKDGAANGGTEVFTIEDGTGNIGIGTDSPLAKLDVYGTARIGGTVSDGRRADFDTNGILTLAYGDNNNVSNLILQNTATDATTNHGNNILWQFGTNASAIPINAGRISVIKEQQWTSTGTTQDSALTINLAENGSLGEKVRITSAGDVGINSTAPEYTLDLGETSASTIRLVSENNGTAIRVGAGGVNNNVTLLRVDGETSNQHGESDSAKYGFSLKYMGSRSGNDNSLSIFSDNQTGTAVEAVTVLQDGKIGIGTDNPSYKFHVVGNTNIDGTFTVNGSAVSGGGAQEAFKTIAVSGQSDVVADAAADTLTLIAGSNMTITTNATNDEITFAASGGGGGGGSSLWTSTGYTGIGTSSAVGIGTKIEIIPHDDQDGGTLSFEGSAGNLLSITNNLSSGSIFAVNDISGSPSIDVNADGTVLVAPHSTTEKVGVGTLTPGYKLDVVGDLNFTGTLYQNGSVFNPGVTPSGGEGAVQFNSSSNLSGISTLLSVSSTDFSVGIGTIINIKPYDDQDGGTLSFEGSAGNLLSITNNLSSGSIFAVNDISGAPSIDVNADGTVSLNGTVEINGAAPVTTGKSIAMAMIFG